MTRKNQSGMTLLEILLVVTIGASFMLASIRAYQYFNQENQFEQMQATVDTLFQALASYYRTNCYGTKEVTRTGAPVNPGTLNPMLVPSPASLFGIKLDDLITDGYLQAQPLANPLVDNTDATLNYILQFNRSKDLTPVRVTACIGQVNEVCTPYSNELPKSGINVSSSVIWRAQVAVLANNADLAELYKTRLGANCTSTLVGSVVSPCSENTPGPYIVWERLPSFASPNTTSAYWLSLPQVTQFNLQYTHDPMYELQNSNAGSRYYLCGG